MARAVAVSALRALSGFNYRMKNNCRFFVDKRGIELYRLEYQMKTIPIPLKGKWHRIAAKMADGAHHDFKTLPEVRGLCLAIRNCGFLPVFRKQDDGSGWRVWRTGKLNSFVKHHAKKQDQ